MIQQLFPAQGSGQRALGGRDSNRRLCVTKRPCKMLCLLHCASVLSRLKTEVGALPLKAEAGDSESLRVAVTLTAAWVV